MVRGSWVAWAVDLDRHPAILRLREATGDETAEAYFLRALAFCKAYADHGCIQPKCDAELWDDLRAFVRWPERFDPIKQVFRLCGLVEGAACMLLGWRAYNGWILERSKADAKRKAEERKKQARGDSNRRAAMDRRNAAKRASRKR